MFAYIGHSSLVDALRLAMLVCLPHASQAPLGFMALELEVGHVLNILTKLTHIHLIILYQHDEMYVSVSVCCGCSGGEER